MSKSESSNGNKPLEQWIDVILLNNLLGIFFTVCYIIYILSLDTHFFSDNFQDDCSLHLHLSYSRKYGITPPLSEENAPGIIMAHGICVFGF